MKSSKYYSTKSAICPFYKRETKEMLCCFGVIDDSVIHLAFAKNKGKIDYRKQYCWNNYSKCPIAKMLEKVNKNQ